MEAAASMWPQYSPMPISDEGFPVPDRARSVNVCRVCQAVVLTVSQRWCEFTVSPHLT